MNRHQFIFHKSIPLRASFHLSFFQHLTPSFYSRGSVSLCILRNGDKTRRFASACRFAFPLILPCDSPTLITSLSKHSLFLPILLIALKDSVTSSRTFAAINISPPLARDEYLTDPPRPRSKCLLSTRRSPTITSIPRNHNHKQAPAHPPCLPPPHAK